MDKTSINSFSKGLQTDLNNLSMPNTSVTDALNATLVTGDGDEMLLQTDMGNVKVVWRGKQAQLRPGFMPVGLKEYGGIIYIVSVNPSSKDGNGNMVSEIGTFPSPDYANYNDTVINRLQWDYRPLNNLHEKGISDSTGVYHFTTTENNIMISGQDTEKLQLQDDIKYRIQKANSEYEVQDAVISTPDSNAWICSYTLKVTDIFTTRLLSLSLENPVSIEIQKSYDDSVNIILNDGLNIPRIINSRFSAQAGNTYKIIQRTKNDNIYTGSSQKIFDLGTSMTKRIQNIPLIKFNGVGNSGNMPVGNYVFYFRYSDVDGNQTDYVAESGVVSCFKGNDADPFSIDGGFENENSGKNVSFKLTNIDPSYDYMIVDWSRSTSAVNNSRKTMIKTISKTYPVINGECNIIITGDEETEDITADSLNSQYTVFGSVKSMAQAQNMLFQANVTQSDILYTQLTSLSQLMLPFAKRRNIRDKIGYVSTQRYDDDTVEDDKNHIYPYEYYNTKNIYYNVGYWNNEYYRIGVVYIFNDNTLSPVYNIRGRDNLPIGALSSSNYTPCTYGTDDFTKHIDPADPDYYLKSPAGSYDGNYRYENRRGVIRINDTSADVSSFQIYSICIDTSAAKQIIDGHPEWHIKGMFFVRQKRMPTILGQCYTIPYDKNSNLPLIFRKRYKSELFRTLGNHADIKNTRINDDYHDIFETIDNNDVFWKTRDINVVGESFLFDGGNGKTEFNFKRSDNIASCENDIYYKYPYNNSEFLGDGTEKQIIDYLDYEGRLFYFPAKNYSSTISSWDHLIPSYVNRLDEQLEFDYNGYFKSCGAECALCPDYFINQPYYNQFFTGTKLYVERSCIQPEHDYLFQDGNYKNGKFRQYYTGVYKAYPVYGKEIYITGVGDAVPIASTNDIKEHVFRALAGNENVAYKFRQFFHDVPDGYKGGDNWYSNDSIFGDDDDYNTSPFVRGAYGPYLGLSTDEDAFPFDLGDLLTIFVPGYGSSPEDIKDYFDIRISDSSQYYPISDRKEIVSVDNQEECFRGDCFTVTFTERLNRNFQDPTAPTNDIIIQNNNWQNNYSPTGDDADAKLAKINLGDVNAVKLGSWLTFKCYSNYNISIRSNDDSHAEEKALTGLSRSFYPLAKPSTAGANKIPESQSMNDGFNATVGQKYYFAIPDVQYVKNTYRNRVYYSDISQQNAFRNGYRVVQANHYRDYNPEYGQIIKLIEMGSKIIVVFEHAVGIADINQNELTAEGSDVYLSSHNVLPEKLLIISDMYGSQWPDSIIKTPYYVYGIDTVSKKIWRTDGTNAIQVISDFVIERFLNENINITEKDDKPYLGIRNVKSHYNANKQDVMFTFYNSNDIYDAMNGTGDPSILSKQLIDNPYKMWNICYNEIARCFSTFYSWMPSYSANIDNLFFSFDEYLSRHMVLGETKNDIRSYTTWTGVNPQNGQTVTTSRTILNWDNDNEFKGFIWKHGNGGNSSDVLQKQETCNWYGSQHPFEFEFVVRDDASVNKTFDNIQIISNKTQPESFHFTINGEDYSFANDKVNMYYRQEATKNMFANLGSLVKYDPDFTKISYLYDVSRNAVSTIFPLYYAREFDTLKTYSIGNEMLNYVGDDEHNKIRDYQNLSGSDISVDYKTGQFDINTHTKCVPVNSIITVNGKQIPAGRLRGNAKYENNRWNIQIPSIKYMQKNENWDNVPPIVINMIPNDVIAFTVSNEFLPNTYNIGQVSQDKWTFRRETKIRDKTIRIRIRYDGRKFVTVSAIKTIYSEN